LKTLKGAAMIPTSAPSSAATSAFSITRGAELSVTCTPMVSRPAA